jgi:hypothetical protein
MATLVQSWSKRATIGGDITSFLEAHIAYGVRRVGTCSLMLPLPVPDNVVVGADVTVEVAKDGVWFGDPLFTGTVRQIDEHLTAAGAVAIVSCEGPLYRTTYSVGFLIFAGDARGLPQNVITTPKHLGTATIAWYEVDAPTGTTYDAVVTPTTDSAFIWLAGIVHGSNSYDESVDDRKITKWSRVEVYQDGAKIGYANLPESNEQWADELDYTDHGEWDDLERFIAAPIVETDGDVTFRFISGTKPGTSSRDEYEIDDVTWQTAGKQSIRQMVRGLYKRCGLTAYAVHEVRDIDGNFVRLGGNGLVSNGQVTIGRREMPYSFITRILDLFGFAQFDCPDGVVRVKPFRGVPPVSVATFTEGATILGVPRNAIEPRDVWNRVLVEGAAGNDEDGRRFSYSYRTADEDILPDPTIPDPPGVGLLAMSSGLLVSDELCEQVGGIQEANAGGRSISWDAWPRDGLSPAAGVTVTAPTVGFDGDVWLESIRYDIDSGGYRMSCTGWSGTGTAFDETPDPDPDEDDAEPIEPRPDDEWTPYSPIAGVA